MVDKKKAQDEIQQITELIKQTVPVERIYLFGSHVYGEPHTHSDYDFFVVLPDGGMRTREATRLVRRAIAYTPLMTPFDVLAAHLNRFDEMKKYNTLERKIARDGRLLYERT